MEKKRRRPWGGVSRENAFQNSSYAFISASRTTLEVKGIRCFGAPPAPAQETVRNPSGDRLVASITMLISRCALQVSFSLLAGFSQNFSIPSQSGR